MSEYMEIVDWDRVIEDLLHVLNVPRNITEEQVWQLCRKYFASG